MKKIKVYLQYPWKFPDSPYYKYLIENAPEGIHYLNAGNQKGVLINKNFFWFSNFLKRNIRRFVDFFGTSFPNTHLSPDGDYDIIHCAHCLSKNKNKPWVADIEGIWQMYLGKKKNIPQSKLKKILLDKNCKKILPWTESVKKEIEEVFPEVKHKLEVVYPAIPEKKFVKRKKKSINLIFSGRYFYWKGGLDALEAIDILTKKYKNVYGVINSEVPEKIKDKYMKNKKISFYGLIPQEKLFELYRDSDIFVYPGYSDSFGFGYLEAMSFGLPTVTVDGFARKEIIDEGKTGFVIDKPKNLNPLVIDKLIVQELVKKVSELIENPFLKKNMSNECIKVIKGGKFSLKVRNRKLKKIYEFAK
ncbi:MAG: glycosyltransferase family 4 protein [Nanoarchaeota archaeon]|nr:glycosyltransferase family 4 protein [Nanoarchaeota archaeon]